MSDPNGSSMSDQGVGILFDDEEVRLLLLGEEDEPRIGLERIHQRLRDALCGIVRKRYPGLTSDDLADLWAQTVVDFYKKVRAGEFDPNRPLVPYLRRIILRRAADMRRRRTTDEKALAAVGKALRSTTVGNWWARTTQAERGELAEIIRKALGTLEGKQGTVMQVFVDQYPETASMQYLRREVSRETGKEETLAAVKRALQEARAKVRQYLKRKGLPQSYGVADERNK